MRRSIVSKLLLCGVILLSNTSTIRATELSTASSSLQAVTANQISVTESGSSEIFSYPNFSDLSGLTLVAAATQVNNKLRITPAKPDQVGAVWYGQPVFVRTNFVTSFAFQITEPGGGNDPDGNPGADGFAFVLQNHSATIVGAGGGAIGYGNIPNSVAIEFDTWNNGPDNHNGDPNGNHISVHTRGAEPNSSDHAYALGATTIIPNLSDGVVHHATIRYSSGRLEIAVDNLSQPVLSIPLDLATTLKLDDGKAWIGFSAATGVYENHDILSWSFQGNTAPQVQNVIINPTSPTDQADLALSYEYTDTENNPEDKSLTQIRWYRNSLLQPAFNNQMVIPQNVTYLGEEWCVTVRPHDGIVYGLTTVPTCVVIEPDSNHLPEASNLQIAPTAPTDDDNLLLILSSE